MSEQPILYHGDEIEIYTNEATWDAEKSLRVLKHHGCCEWQGICFLLELKVDNPDAPGFAGVFIDGAAEPSVEIKVETNKYEIFERTLDIGSWGEGPHEIELMLRTDGGQIYNQLFEVYVIPPLPFGSVVKAY